ncbi:serine hydrolase domain-containing protein [Altererythrobacter sp. ZODW24]|uniref:serine hydrolase domain-containing protein n=1 Tax=Altererythrobacter sp. ZODW24 TaxID=2185142 RepID=UPI0013B3FDE8|nr:serine hydrolase domain-containing protein [Altererythrobacter sp. ZODW24]
MNVEERAEEHLVAALLNPERNITGPSRMYKVTKKAPDRYSLSTPNDDVEFSSVELNASDKSLTMGFGPIEKFALQFIDPAADLAKDFFGEGEERQLEAPSSNGAWPVGSLDEAGFDRDAIHSLINSIANESGAEEQPQLVHSLLVARGGKLVVEEYFRSETSDKPHDIRSAGKTFASILVGALMQEGHDLGADTPINRFIEVPNEPDAQPLTLSHLLTHQSGFDCYDGNRQTAGHEDVMWQQGEFPNLWEYTAALDFAATPGERYAYCSGGMNLIGAALAGSTGESVLSLLQTRLFEPLGFQNAYWNVMPNGEAYLGGGAYLRTRDLAKIGQLYLNQGKWAGKQLIDKDWVAASTAKQVAITPETTGLDETGFSNFYFGGEDGYGWHRHQISVGGETYQSYEASGNGGQIVVVVPEFDLVVAMTGGNYGQGYIWGKWRQNIVGDVLIASLRRQ